MDTISSFISNLRREGISLWLEGEQVHYKAPRGVFSERHATQLRERLPQLLEFLRAEGARRSEPVLRAGSLDGIVPVTVTQQSFVEYYAKLENPAIQAVWFSRRVLGELDAEALRESIRLIVTRHSVLRTGFRYDSSGAAYAVINPITQFEFDCFDLRGTHVSKLDEEIAATIVDAVRRRFDLSAGPLMRVVLLKIGAGEHALVIVSHHSVFDRMSIGPLLDDLKVAYSALSRSAQPDLPELQIQYADYARWQQEWASSAAGRRQFEICMDQFRDVKAPFDLPCEPVLPLAAPEAGTRTSFALRDDSVRAIRAFARQEGETLSTVALAAFAVLLARWRGRYDVFIKTVHHGRDRAELANLIGCFAVTLVMRLDLEGAATFLDVFERVRVAKRTALVNGNTPWVRLKPALERITGEQPVLSTIFNFNVREQAGESGGDADGSVLQLRDLELTVPADSVGPPNSMSELTNVFLNIQMLESDAELACSVRYLRRKLSADVIDAFCRGFAGLLEQVARTHGRFALPAIVPS